MKWSQEYTVRYHDTDANEIVSPSNIFKYLQEAATCQMQAQRPSYGELLNQNKAFILSGIRVEIYDSLCFGENITVSTWGCDARGFTFPRSYSISRGDELICEANSTWALVDTRDKKLLRACDVELNYCTDKPLELSNPVRFRIPAELPLSLVGEYTIRYYDTDVNGHMNNTNYPDMLTNALPSPENKIIKSIAISYQNEARVGDYIKLYMGKTDGKYYMRSVHEDGRINVEAEIIAEALN